MLDRTKLVYQLSTYSIEKRRDGLYFFKSPFFEDEKKPRRPYSFIGSASKMIAHELAKEAVRRHFKN